MKQNVMSITKHALVLVFLVSACHPLDFHGENIERECRGDYCDVRWEVTVENHADEHFWLHIDCDPDGKTVRITGQTTQTYRGEITVHQSVDISCTVRHPHRKTLGHPSDRFRIP